eukprot:1138675-Pyramimonas_sp.AAC.1
MLLHRAAQPPRVTLLPRGRPSRPADPFWPLQRACRMLRHLAKQRRKLFALNALSVRQPRSAKGISPRGA